MSNSPHPWQIPEITQVGRLPMRSGTLPYPSASLALDGDLRHNPWYHLLNGEWDFHLFPTVADADRALSDYHAGGAAPFSRTIAGASVRML